MTERTTVSIETAGGRRMTDMLADPSVSSWLQRALRDLEARDPVKAYHDAAELLAEQHERLREIGLT